MRLINHPIVLFLISFVLLWLSAHLGAAFRKWGWVIEGEDREDFGVIVAASLTLLGLIIGFSFSMAISRYDQRKNYEEAEANAIGTEYVRAELLPAADAEEVQALLKNYTDLRIRFYVTRDAMDLQQVNAATAQLQTNLWNAIRPPSEASPTPVMALVVSGMNDTLNSQSYTQAAWWNRIPTAAWLLMGAIAICCNFLIGHAAHGTQMKAVRFVVLPLIVAISFLLIADIDSPRTGIIRVRPQNLISFADSFHNH